MGDMTATRLQRPTRLGLVRLALVLSAVALAGLVVSVSARATTTPQLVRIDSVVLTPKGGISLAFTSVPRGGVVIFKVHNASTEPRRFVLVPGINRDPGQGGSGFQTKLLKHGQLTTFQLEFDLRGVYRYLVKDSNGRAKASGRFRVT